MSALAQGPDTPRPRAMQLADLDRVLAIERVAYDFPWTRGNFVDSIAGSHWCELLADARNAPIGYFVAMPVVDELHLLNLTIAPAQQQQGHALTLLNLLRRRCRERGLFVLWLEVRASNARARHVYLRHGFIEVGLRRGYYPAPRAQREDAIVMSLKVRGIA